MTEAQTFDYDVAVVGLGRVGLPLALSFADRGLRVLGMDRDESPVRAVESGRMHFHENGMQEILDRVREGGTLATTTRLQDVARAEHIVLTVGTPMLRHIEIDVSQIRSVLDGLMPVLRLGHHVVLRSTVAPGTTEFVAGYIEKHRGLVPGEDIFVAHAPERIAENRFVEEIRTLPHIVGGIGEASTARVSRLMAVFGAPTVPTTPLQAELAKIWTNVLRYAQFALPNMLMMQCEDLGANVFEVIDLVNRDYPRGGMARPGLTAGTCLRKDFAFSEERSSAPSMLLAVSRVHETVPNFLVEGMTDRLGHLRDRKVAVLGLTFKRGSDDLRDSLSLKIVRLLERQLANVATHDPYAAAVATDSLDDALSGAHAVVIATDHDAYRDGSLAGRIARAATDDCLIVDPWDVTGARQVFVSSRRPGGGGASQRDATGRARAPAEP